MSRIAFLGLGAMGSRMARRLIDAGHDLSVWNRSPARSAPFRGMARIAATPAEAGDGAGFVLSMVTDDDAARATWLGTDGALDAARPGALAVEMSTVSPGWIAELSRAAAQAGVPMIDAPVAGSRPQAEAGELAFLVGGAETDVARVDPIARAMGKAVIHAGEAGSGIALKMMVNGLLAVQSAAMAELLAYGAARGLLPERALALLSPLPVTSPAAAAVGGLIAGGNHTPMFPIDLLVKDLGYLLADVDAPVMAGVRDAFARASARGLGGQHISAVAARS